MGRWSVGGLGNLPRLSRRAARADRAAISSGFEQRLQGGRQLRIALQLVLEGGQVSGQLGGEGLPGEIPDDGAQLGLGVEADAVVDQPEVIVRIEKDVAALAVGVVDQQVEQRHRAQALAVFFVQVEVMVFGVVVDEQLQRAGAEGAIGAVDGGRHQLPAQRLADDEGGGLAAGQAGLGEIPQRALAAGGFVDRQEWSCLGGYLNQEGVVGAPDELAL